MITIYKEKSNVAVYIEYGIDKIDLDIVEAFLAYQSKRLMR